MTLAERRQRYLDLLDWYRNNTNRTVTTPTPNIAVIRHPDGYICALVVYRPLTGRIIYRHRRLRPAAPPVIVYHNTWIMPAWPHVQAA